MTLALAEEWVGLVSMRTFQRRGKTAYIFGEQHEDVPNASVLAVHPHHVATNVLQAIAAKPNETVHMYLELNNDFYNDAYRAHRMGVVDFQAVQQFNTAFSPIEKMYEAHYAGKLPKNVVTHFCNVRNRLPFGLFYLWTDVNRFIDLYANVLQPLHGTGLSAKCTKWAKTLETQFLKHVENTDASVHFFESLVLPNVNTPTWFTDIEKDIFGDVQPNALKTLLRFQDATTYYPHIVAGFRGILTLFFKHHGHHTAVLRKMKRRNKRHVDTPVIHHDATLLKGYFFHMFVFLQDVFMIGTYARMRRQGQHHVFMVGELHVPYLTLMLEPMANSVKAWKHLGDFTLHKQPAYEIPINAYLPTFKLAMENYINDPSPPMPVFGRHVSGHPSGT